jgi:ParB-like chromosome segregation protein Spo0J
MSEAALKELAADIKTNGQHEPATITPDGMLLDGRNREAACALNGIELKTVVYEGDPIAFSISKNKHRRHMDKVSLAFVGAELAKLKPGSNQFQTRQEDVADATPSEQIAREIGVSRNAIQNAKAIVDGGTAEIIDLAKSKRVGLRSAADYVRHTPKEEQVADPTIIKGGTRTPKRDEARPAIRAKLEKGEPFNVPSLMAELGMSGQPIMIAEAYERGRLEAMNVPLTARQEQAVERATKAAMKDLADKFDQIVAEELQKHLKKRDADDVLAVEQAREVLSHNSGRLRPPLNPQEFATVLWALHPDNQSETKVAEAFIIIRRKKHILCDAGPIVRKSPPLPPVPVRKTARRG